MPAKSVSPLSMHLNDWLNKDWLRDIGPAVWMRGIDHKDTESYGSGQDSELYRLKQSDLISQGRIREAIQMDIDDIRAKFPDGRYEPGLRQLEQYIERIKIEELVQQYSQLPQDWQTTPPRQLLHYNTLANQIERERGLFEPTASKISALQQEHKQLKTEITQLQPELQQQTERHNRLEANQREWYRPWGVPFEKVYAAYENMSDTKSVVQDRQDRLAEVNSRLTQQQNEQNQRVERLMQPEQYAMILAYPRLQEPAVQTRLQDIQQTVKGLEQWKTAAIEMGQSPSYVNQIQGVIDSYLDSKPLSEAGKQLLQQANADLQAYQQMQVAQVAVQQRDLGGFER
jgi:DNA repair exonuclease SbcCD ATPase subunit